MITVLAALFGPMLVAQNAKDTTLFIQEGGLIKKVHQTESVISLWQNKDNANFSEANLRELEASNETTVFAEKEGGVPTSLWPIKIQRMVGATSYHLNSDGTIFHLTKKAVTTSEPRTQGVIFLLWILVPFLLAVALGFSTYDTQSLLIIYSLNALIMGITIITTIVFAGGEPLPVVGVICFAVCSALMPRLLAIYLDDSWLFLILSSLFIFLINFFFVPYAYNLSAYHLDYGILGQYAIFYSAICLFSIGISIVVNYGKAIRKYLYRKTHIRWGLMD